MSNENHTEKAGNHSTESGEKRYKQRPYNRTGHCSVSYRTNDSSGSIMHVEGTLYIVGDRDWRSEDRDKRTFLQSETADGSATIFRYSERFDEQGMGVVTDQAIIEEVERQSKEDEEIMLERINCAKALAKDDMVLAEIILWSMEYKGGTESPPRVTDGISFYKVGHNASHDFYAGTKDGKRYAMAIGEGEDVDENGFRLLTEEYDNDGKQHWLETPKNTGKKAYYEVDAWGYMGHF